MAQLYLGVQADEAQRMGERVARFQAAADHLEAAAKQSKTLEGVGVGVSDRGAISDTLTFANGETSLLVDTASNNDLTVFSPADPGCCYLRCWGRTFKGGSLFILKS